MLKQRNVGCNPISPYVMKIIFSLKRLKIYLFLILIISPSILYTAEIEKEKSTSFLLNTLFYILNALMYLISFCSVCLILFIIHIFLIPFFFGIDIQKKESVFECIMITSTFAVLTHLILKIYY